MHRGEVLALYETKVAPDWVDYNGHMNDAAYALVFSRAGDALMDRIGLDAAARKATGPYALYAADDAALFQGGERGRPAQRRLPGARA